jgi:autophagy-related protein 18
MAAAAGVCALSPADGSLLALPTERPGQVLLYDALNLHAIQTLDAHRSAVVAMAFNYDGTMLATASDQVRAAVADARPAGAADAAGREP